MGIATAAQRKVTRATPGAAMWDDSSHGASTLPTRSEVGIQRVEDGAS